MFDIVVGTLNPLTWYSVGMAEVYCARLHTDTAPRSSVQESRDEFRNWLQKGAIGLLLYKGQVYIIY